MANTSKVAMFFQADFVKGYRFWDETGVIANSLVDRFKGLTYRADVSPASLVAGQPTDPADALVELRINPLHFWCALRPALPWSTLRGDIERLADQITRAAYVTQYSRLGLRTYVVWRGDSLEQVNDIQRSRIMKASEWQDIGEVAGGEYVLNMRFGRLAARLAVTAVQNVQTVFATKMPSQALEPPAPDADQPDYGVMLDLDLVDNSINNTADLYRFLNESNRLLDEVIVPFVSRQVLGGSS